ncbi:uncharacterized protein BXZ73DRAFT_44149, partial [Epithele typhae]|uniref:uncharacterized protein n=1 Tax=Epithele typhae TaxID=378194 RepID=UPI002008DEA5
HLRDLELTPDAGQYVDALVDIADALGVDDLSYTSYSSAIDALEEDYAQAACSSIKMQYAEEQLMEMLASTLHEDHLLEEWLRRLESTSTGDTVSSLERQKAALLAKGKEYQREFDDLKHDMPEEPPVTISDLVALRKQLKREEQALKEKRARVETFQGLPPNIELARHALQERRDAQMKLIQIREKLLGEMASGVN